MRHDKAKGHIRRICLQMRTLQRTWQRILTLSYQEAFDTAYQSLALWSHDRPENERWVHVRPLQ